MNATEQRKLWSATEMSKRWGISKQKILAMFHSGVITAEIAEEKTIRFDLETVEKQLKERAAKKA